MIKTDVAKVIQSFDVRLSYFTHLIAKFIKPKKAQVSLRFGVHWCVRTKSSTQ
jgi:hypothetical protein